MYWVSVLVIELETHGYQAYPHSTPLSLRWESAGVLAQVGQGPVMASVMPGYWMLTNIVLPSGEKQTPASSEFV